MTQDQPPKPHQSNSGHHIYTKYIELYKYPEYWCWYTLFFWGNQIHIQVTWDTSQLDGIVGCWNVLVITSSSWYCFGYQILMFQFTASCIDFICCNMYKVYSRDCFFTEFEHLFCCEYMARCCFLQTSPCCHSFHGSSCPITRRFAMTCGKKIPLAIYREITGMKTKVIKMFPVFTDQHSHLESSE